MQKPIDIGTPLQFTPEDLNRQGKLSAAQIARLEVALRRQRVGYSVTVGATAILAIMIYLIFSIFGAPVLAFFLAALTIIILIGAAGFVVFVYVRAKRKLVQGSVSTACGKVSSYKYRRSAADEYFVRVQRIRFNVSENTFAAFHNGLSYVVYYVPLMRPTIVAAEEIA